MALALAGTAWAMSRNYTSGEAGLSATATSAYTAFTDNHTGGNSAAFGALYVKISSRGTGTCFYNLGELSAVKTAANRLPAGASVTVGYNTGRDMTGWAGVSYVCSAGQTATLDVEAWR